MRNLEFRGQEFRQQTGDRQNVTVEISSHMWVHYSTAHARIKPTKMGPRLWAGNADHPTDAEFVCTHPKQRGPEGGHIPGDRQDVRTYTHSESRTDGNDPADALE